MPHTCPRTSSKQWPPLRSALLASRSKRAMRCSSQRCVSRRRSNCAAASDRGSTYNCRLPMPCGASSRMTVGGTRPSPGAGQRRRLRLRACRGCRSENRAAAPHRAAACRRRNSSCRRRRASARRRCSWSPRGSARSPSIVPCSSRGNGSSGNGAGSDMSSAGPQFGRL